MASGNLGEYLRDEYTDHWKKSLTEYVRFTRQDFESNKNRFSAEKQTLLEKRLKELEEMISQDKRPEANRAVVDYLLIGLCIVSGAEFPEKRTDDIKKEAGEFAKRVLEKVKGVGASFNAQEEKKIIDAIALDTVGDFMWAISDGPLSINSSLLENMSDPEYVQRCVNQVIKYLEETAAQ